MKKRCTLVLGMLFAGLMQLQAQTDTAKTAKNSQAFTLEEAQKFALANSPVLKNSNLDLEIAKKKIWETTAIGLPQVNGKFSASYMLKMSPTIEQFSGLGSLGSSIGRLYEIAGIQSAGMPSNIANGLVAKVLDSVKNDAAAADANKEQTLKDMKWGATVDITVSQLIFSGSYLVGLQTTKVFKQFSEIAITKSTNDLLESVTNSYYYVLVMEENKRITDSSYTETLKTLSDMEAMYKSGFIEETAVDQVRLTANNLKNLLMYCTNSVNVSKNLLRMQMGLEMSIDIVLKEKLENIISSNIQLSLLSTELNLDKNTEFLQVKNYVKINELQVKYQKSTLLPDVAAFYQYDHPFNTKAMSFTPPHMIGAAVNIPLFGSGAKCARIKQANLNLQKAKNNEFQYSQLLKWNHSQALTVYNSALNKIDVNKENMELSKRIYNKTLIKFKNGVSTSMELTQTLGQFLQSETAYFNTILELVNAKNVLEKLYK